MDISFIALDRILETSIIKGNISIEELKRKGKIILRDIRKLSDEEIVKELERLGLTLNKETFGSVCKEFPSSEALYFCLDKVKKRTLSDSDEDKLWMGLTVLWERWFPDIPNFEMLDDKMQQGYDLSVQQKPIEACNVWWGVWEDILYLMDNHNIPDIKKFDEKFRGTQSVTN